MKEWEKYFDGININDNGEDHVNNSINNGEDNDSNSINNGEDVNDSNSINSGEDVNDSNIININGEDDYASNIINNGEENENSRSCSYPNCSLPILEPEKCTKVGCTNFMHQLCMISYDTSEYLNPRHYFRG